MLPPRRFVGPSIPGTDEAIAAVTEGSPKAERFAIKRPTVARRRNVPQQYAPAVAQQLASGARGLILAGNAREPHDPGPPVVTEEQIRDELGLAFRILDLHEFRFDEAPGVPERFLGWSCLVERR